MKILFLTNNPEVTLPLFKWLKQEEGSDCVVLCKDEISASQFHTGGVFNDIGFVVSYNYIHIIKQDVISLFPHRVINLHISMLPWNRGRSPNIWSFLEGTPAGVTIHEIDAGVDTGDILLQREIVFDYKIETLRSAYEKSHELIQKIFCENWNNIKSGRITPRPQQGTLHFTRDLQRYECLINYDDTIEEFLRKVTPPPPKLIPDFPSVVFGVLWFDDRILT